MLFSRALIPTMKEAPADATNASHVLLSRAGYIRKVGAGIYDFLPLGYRVLRKVEAIVREEMDRAGALGDPHARAPARPSTSRRRAAGTSTATCSSASRTARAATTTSGPTHEEIVTDIARREIRSWRELPKNLYQVQVKFRDEPRPRGGLLRGREFLMKDAYSFDADEEGATRELRDDAPGVRAHLRPHGPHATAWSQADSGAIGGSTSAEFQVLVDSGEDAIVACDKCDYAANVEVATVTVDDARRADAPPREPRARRCTRPAHGSIEEVAEFLGVAPRAMLKSLLYVGGRATIVMAVVRGDHERQRGARSRARSASTRCSSRARPTSRRRRARRSASRGPWASRARVLVDRAASLVAARRHRRQRDRLPPQERVLRPRLHGRGRRPPPGDDGRPVPQLRRRQARSVPRHRGGAHLHPRDEVLAQPMGATFLDEKQQQRPLVMGCYGIGVSRLVATTIEQHHDDNGIRWPMSIAPYHVHLVHPRQGRRRRRRGARALRRARAGAASRSSGTTATSARA